jgi:hypothetical protein
MTLWNRQSGVDYKTAVWAYYRYYPSEVAAIIFTVLFALATFAHLYQLFRHRTWFFIPFVIGGFCKFFTASARSCTAANADRNKSNGLVILVVFCPAMKAPIGRWAHTFSKPS